MHRLALLFPLSLAACFDLEEDSASDTETEPAADAEPPVPDDCGLDSDGDGIPDCEDAVDDGPDDPGAWPDECPDELRDEAGECPDEGEEPWGECARYAQVWAGAADDSGTVGWLEGWWLAGDHGEGWLTGDWVLVSTDDAGSSVYEVHGMWGGPEGEGELQGMAHDTDDGLVLEAWGTDVVLYVPLEPTPEGVFGEGWFSFADATMDGIGMDGMFFGQWDYGWGVGPATGSYGAWGGDEPGGWIEGIFETPKWPAEFNGSWAPTDESGTYSWEGELGDWGWFSGEAFNEGDAGIMMFGRGFPYGC